MSAASAAGKGAMDKGETGLRKNYLTTTELARLCGVSRFTIINWVDQGKIGTTRTLGGHHRIPISEAMTFLKILHKKKEGAAPDSLDHCWEYRQKTNCERKCRDCLIYTRKIEHCFAMVRQFGKGMIGCEGDCLSCGYFDEFFSFYGKKAALKGTLDAKSEAAVRGRRTFPYSFIYGVGRGVRRMKERMANLGQSVVCRLPWIGRQVERPDG